MRRFITLFVLCSLISIREGRAQGLPPPPPPAPMRGHGLARQQPLMLTTSTADTVLVALEPRAAGPLWASYVNSAATVPSFVQTDGSELRVDDLTPTGRYELRDGSAVSVTNAPGAYPRIYQREAPHRAECRLRVSSARGIAILVEGPGGITDDTSDAVTLSVYFEPTTVADGEMRLDPRRARQVLLLPRSWYAAGVIEMPTGWDRMRLSFFCYGPPARAALPLDAGESLHDSLTIVHPTELTISQDEIRLRRPSRTDLFTAETVGVVSVSGGQIRLDTPRPNGRE